MVITCPALFLSSYITNSFMFSLVFGTSLGALAGVSFMPSIWIGWSVLPENKATLAGVGLAGFNMGPVIYNLLFTFIANPHETQAIKSEDSTYSYFPSNVSNKVPMTIRIFALAIGLTGFLGCFMLQTKNIQVKVEKNSSSMTTIEMLKNKKTWHLFAIGFCLFFFPLYLLNTYKDVAMEYIQDDYFLSVVGALSFIIGSFGRYFYGRMLDKYSWKTVMSSAIATQIICCGLMEYSFANKYLFAFNFIIASFGGTAMFIGLMMITDQVFPKDRWIFSYINMVLILNLSGIYLLRSFFKSIQDEKYFFGVNLVITLIGLVLVLIHKVEKDSVKEI